MSRKKPPLYPHVQLNGSDLRRSRPILQHPGLLTIPGLGFGPLHQTGSFCLPLNKFRTRARGHNSCGSAAKGNNLLGDCYTNRSVGRSEVLTAYAPHLVAEREIGFEYKPVQAGACAHELFSAFSNAFQCYRQGCPKTSQLIEEKFLSR